MFAPRGPPTYEKRPRGYWKDPEHRKQFFLELANEKGINPNQPGAWEALTVAHVLAKKVSLLYLFSSSEIF